MRSIQLPIVLQKDVSFLILFIISIVLLQISSLRYQLSVEKAAAKDQAKVFKEESDKSRADESPSGAVLGPRSLRESEERFLVTERLKDDLQRARKHQIELEAALLERDASLLELRFDLETKVEEVARWQRRAEELQNAYSSTASLLEQAAGSIKGPLSPAAAATVMNTVLSASGGRSRSKREVELEGVIEAMKRVLERLRTDNDRLRRGGFNLQDEDQKKPVYDFEKKATTEKKRADKLEGQVRDLQEKLEDAENSNRKLLQRQSHVATLRTQLRTRDEEFKKLHEEWLLLKEDRDHLRGQLQVFESRVPELLSGSGSGSGQGAVSTTDRSPSIHRASSKLRQVESRPVQRLEQHEMEELAALREENDELTALLREATDTLAMQQAQLKIVANSSVAQLSTATVTGSPPAASPDEIARLQDENKRLRSELSAFDLQFFEEIENLKYSYSEAVKKIKIYEKLYGQK